MNLICNCDSRDINVIDDGILSDKDSLPVMSLRYGGAFTRISSIKYILGPFVCSGKAQPYPSEKSEIDQEQMKNQLNALTDKVKDIETKIESVIAFRVIQVETDEVSSQVALNVSPGKRPRFSQQIIRCYLSIQSHGTKLNIILAIDSMVAYLLHHTMEFIFSMFMQELIQANIQIFTYK